MKILIVDDDEIKSAVIGQYVTSLGGSGRGNIEVDYVSTMGDTIRIAGTTKFDLIILDLMIPYIDAGLADSQAGMEVLRQVRKDNGLNRTTPIVAISSYPDEVEDFQGRFNNMGVVITDFNNINSWNSIIAQIIDDITTRNKTKNIVDFIIFVALEEEKDGYKHTEIVRTSDTIIVGLNVSYMSLIEKEKKIGIIIRLRHMGLVSAVFEVSTALSVFQTDIICMSGICAGLSNEVKLGQLIVAAPAWEYQAGKWAVDGFKIAPSQVPLPPMTRAIIEHTVGIAGFISSLEDMMPRATRRPEIASSVVIGPVATGSAVVADPNRLSFISQQHRKLAGIDMETFGLYYATFETFGTSRHFFSVKCVVDYADAAKEDSIHPYGCLISARACVRLVKSLLSR